MLARLPAVFQHIDIRAAGIFQRIRQDWHAVVGPVVVDGLREGGDIAGEPGRGDGDGPEGVAEDVSKRSSLEVKRSTVNRTGPAVIKVLLSLVG